MRILQSAACLAIACALARPCSRAQVVRKMPESRRNEATNPAASGPSLDDTCFMTAAA
jgi:hypothetical protein